jgi:uncharacterized protein (TIGR03435 family)
MKKAGTLLIASCGVLWSAVALPTPRATLQNTPLAFEVASIKPAAQGNRTRIAFPNGGRFTATSMALKTLLGVAYDVREFQISGGPAWITSERFDIAATSDKPGATTRDVVMMLQTLLTERFKLALHRETRDSQVYGLVVADGGLKLKETPDGKELSLDGGGGRAIGTKVTMGLLSQFLSQQLARTVLDRTGVTGAYDLTLTWTPVDTNPDNPGPSIFTAVEEQLGLKLQSQRGPVEFIVIDGVERPTPN